MLTFKIFDTFKGSNIPWTHILTHVILFVFHQFSRISEPLKVDLRVKYGLVVVAKIGCFCNLQKYKKICSVFKSPQKALGIKV